MNDDDILLLCILLIVICMVLYSLIKKLLGYYHEHKVYKFISWCMTDKQKLDRDRNLSHYILKAQYDLNISEELQLDSDTELQYVDDILEQFQRDTAERYFANNHSFYIPKSKYVIKEKDYFLFLLQGYLSEHQCDYMFAGYDMHSHTISHVNYPGDGFSATYGLSEPAIVFHKILYISYVSTKHNNSINPKKLYCNNDMYEESIKECILTKTLSLSRYRP